MVAYCGVDWPIVLQFTRSALGFLGQAAWPAAAFGGAALLKNDISAILSRISQVEAFGAKAALTAPPQLAPSADPAGGNALAGPGGANPPPPDPDELLDSLDDVLTNILTTNIVDPELRLRWAVRARSVAELARQFEQTYRSIWGSQISLLRRLNGSALLSYEDAKKSYDEAANNPEFAPVYAGYGYDGWLAFLEHSGLIEIAPWGQSRSVSITVRGRRFLAFMFDSRLAENRPF